MDEANNCPSSVLSGYRYAVEGICWKFFGIVEHPARVSINQMKVSVFFIMCGS
jgi:hypothetical protein